MTDKAAVVRQIRGVLNGISEIPETARLAQYTHLAARIASFRTATRPLGRELQSLADSSDPAALQSRWKDIANADEAILRLFSPLAFARERDLGKFQPTELLLDSVPDGFRWADNDAIRKALGKEEKGLTEKVRIADALRLQVEAWARLQEAVRIDRPISRREGCLLTSRGDWEILIALLLEQILGEDAFIAGALSDKDQSEALLTTAGYHPRLGDLFDATRLLSLKAPVVMFPPEARGEIIKAFELVVWNPGADTMHLLTKRDICALRTDALLFGATKAFGIEDPVRGLAINEAARYWREKIGKRYTFSYGAGFLPAEAIVRRQIVILQEELDGVRGLHMVVSAEDEVSGRALGESFTGRTEFEALKIPNDPKERTWMRFKNPELKVPVIVDVITDPVLSDVQIKASDWKNVGSFILGQELFKHIFQEIDKNQQEPRAKQKSDDELTGEILVWYRQQMSDMVEMIKVILKDVEGFDADDIVLVEGTLKDLVGSWEVQNMGALFAAVRDLFFKEIGGDALEAAIAGTGDRIYRAYGTRNPVGGFTTTMGTYLVLYGMTDSAQRVIPERKYEGKTILQFLIHRLTHLAARRGKTVDELRGALPIPIAEAAITIQESLSRTLLSHETRKILGDYAAALYAIGSGTRLKKAHAAALKGVRISKISAGEITRLQRIRHYATVEDLPPLLTSLKGHIDREIALRRRGGNGRETDEFRHQLGLMSKALGDVCSNKLRLRELSSVDVNNILSAVKDMIDEVDHLYHGRDMHEVFFSISLRMAKIVMFLENRSKKPTILLGENLTRVEKRVKRWLSRTRAS